MNNPLHLVIIGSSIFALAVESAVTGLIDAQILLIAPDQIHTTVKEIGHPICILMEKDLLHEQQLWELMQQGHMLVEIDPATTTCTAFYSLRISIVEESDLQQLIQQIETKIHPE